MLDLTQPHMRTDWCSTYFFYFNLQLPSLFKGYCLSKTHYSMILHFILTWRKGIMLGDNLLYHCLFMYFWEHVCATTSYIKFSYAKVNGLEWIPQITASVSITSMACLVFSSYILSIMLRQRRWKILKKSNKQVYYILFF